MQKDDDELRLVSDIFKGDGGEKDLIKLVRPVKNKDAAIKVVFGIAYTQLVELVSKKSTTDAHSEQSALPKIAPKKHQSFTPDTCFFLIVSSEASANLWYTFNNFNTVHLNISMFWTNCTFR